MSAMTMSSELRAYVDSADADSVLGTILIYSVLDRKVPWVELDKKMRETGLSSYVPPEPKDENVFRRVFTNGERKKVEGAGIDGEPKRLLMRELAREAGRYTKRVVAEREVIETLADGSTQKNLVYVELVEVVFDKEHSHRLFIRDLVSPRDDDAWELAQQLRATYENERGCVDGQAIRVVIRDVLDDCRSTSLRPGGGAYFLPQLYVQRAEALETVADVIPGTLVHTLPLIDSTKQRANLKKAFEFESAASCEAVITEMRELIRSGAEISTQRLAAFAKEAKKAKAKLGEYQGVLDDSLSVVEVKLSVMETLQLQLMDQVKA